MVYSFVMVGLVASSSKGVKRKQPEASGVGTSGSKKPKLWWVNCAWVRLVLSKYCVYCAIGWG